MHTDSPSEDLRGITEATQTLERARTALQRFGDRNRHLKESNEALLGEIRRLRQRIAVLEEALAIAKGFMDAELKPVRVAA